MPINEDKEGEYLHVWLSDDELACIANVLTYSRSELDEANHLQTLGISPQEGDGLHKKIADFLHSR